jgi:hypothetical protein
MMQMTSLLILNSENHLGGGLGTRGVLGRPPPPRGMTPPLGPWFMLEPGSEWMEMCVKIVLTFVHPDRNGLRGQIVGSLGRGRLGRGVLGVQVRWWSGC